MSAEELEPESLPATTSIEPGGADVVLRTLVAPHRLGEILLRIAELKLSGQLSLGSDMGRRTIHFHSGFAVASQSSLFGERLGAIGVRHGLLTRDNVARALTHARAHGCGLGQALLDLQRVDSAGLFALLGVQLREVVAASCGAEPLRARFQSGRAALPGLVILRLHPMTAVLTAVMALPTAEQKQLLAAVAARHVLAAPIPSLAQQWLADLGYLGELDKLCAGEPTVTSLRSRLLARYRPGSESAFDPARVAFSLPVARNESPRPNAVQVADLATISLLLAGGLRLADSTDGPRADAAGLPLNTAAGLQLSLADAVEHPLTEIRPGASSYTDTDADRAIESYLCGARQRELAAATAVWGPSAEAKDATVPAELMTLYLRLKPERRPAVVLDVEPSATSEQILAAHAQRVELIAAAGREGASPHLRCRAAELARCFDDALEQLLPGSVTRPTRTNGRTAPSIAPMTSSPSSTSIAPEAPAQHPSPLPPQGQVRVGAEALASKVEALMRASNWHGVLETLDAKSSDASQAFTLRLARAMAHRELEGQRTRRRRIIAALAIGIAVGAALQFVAHPWLSAYLKSAGF